MDKIEIGIMADRDNCITYNNKCINCSERANCMFEQTYKIANQDSDLLGPTLPGELKDYFRSGDILVYLEDDNVTGFCIYHICKKLPHISVYKIATDRNHRGKGVGKKLLTALAEMYHRPIRAVCITGTSSEKFWSSVAHKVGTKFSRKGTELSIYQKDDIKGIEMKEELF